MVAMLAAALLAFARTTVLKAQSEAGNGRWPPTRKRASALRQITENAGKLSLAYAFVATSNERRRSSSAIPYV
jgi:hypothetical protein